MKQSILFLLRSGALYSGLLLAACGEEAALGTLDATLIDPPGPGEGYSLVRASGEHEIQEMAVSDDYVFFASHWQGVYRASKYGGEIGAIEQDDDALTRALAANRDRVFWAHATFGRNDEPNIEMRTRAAAGGATSELSNARWAGAAANYTNNMLADDHHLYLMDGDPSGPTPTPYSVLAAPVAGGDALRVALTEGDPAQGLTEFPSWVPDYPAVYVSNCRFGAGACSLVQGDFLTGTSQAVAELQRGQAVAAVDETAIYLQDDHHIWRMSKTDFTTTSIFETSESEYVHWYLQVDDTHVYFINQGTAAGWQIRAVPKAGGSAYVLGSGSQLNRGVWRMLQDEQFIFILTGTSSDAQGNPVGNEILAFPKEPAVAGVE